MRMYERLTLKKDDTALEYSYNPDQLKDLFKQISIEVGQFFKFKKLNEMFDGSEAIDAVCYNVKIIKGDTIITFVFNGSYADSQGFTQSAQGDPIIAEKAKNIIKNHYRNLLYCILYTVNCDYYVDDSFEEFCDNFGYDNDSIRASDLYKTCIVHSRELHKIFTIKDTECLPS